MNAQECVGVARICDVTLTVYCTARGHSIGGNVDSCLWFLARVGCSTPVPR